MGGSSMAAAAASRLGACSAAGAWITLLVLTAVQKELYRSQNLPVCFQCASATLELWLRLAAPACHEPSALALDDGNGAQAHHLHTHRGGCLCMVSSGPARWPLLAALEQSWKQLVSTPCLHVTAPKASGLAFLLMPAAWQVATTASTSCAAQDGSTAGGRLYRTSIQWARLQMARLTQQARELGCPLPASAIIGIPALRRTLYDSGASSAARCLVATRTEMPRPCSSFSTPWAGGSGEGGMCQARAEDKVCRLRWPRGSAGQADPPIGMAQSTIARVPCCRWS